MTSILMAGGDCGLLRFPAPVAAGVVLVTLRLSGSVPAELVKRIRQGRRALAVSAGWDDRWIRRWTFTVMERWLDGPGADGCLVRPDIAPLVMEAIAFREFRGEWTALEYVLMPSHVHLLVRLPEAGAGPAALAGLIDRFRGWTGRRVRERLGNERLALWQREWFDYRPGTLVELQHLTGYLRLNPVKAGLCRTPTDWPWGSLRWRQRLQAGK